MILWKEGGGAKMYFVTAEIVAQKHVSYVPVESLAQSDIFNL